MLMALNTGHDGSLTTVHANSPEDALRRVETLALMAGVGLPHAAVREQVASAIDLVVHQRARARRRGAGSSRSPRSCASSAAPARARSTACATAGRCGGRARGRRERDVSGLSTAFAVDRSRWPFAAGLRWRSLARRRALAAARRAPLLARAAAPG